VIAFTVVLVAIIAGVRPTDVAIAPEPGGALGAAFALVALRVVRRREAV
jgi:MYXO-CTERM domain-containing protein